MKYLKYTDDFQPEEGDWVLFRNNNQRWTKGRIIMIVEKEIIIGSRDEAYKAKELRFIRSKAWLDGDVNLSALILIVISIISIIFFNY